MSVDLEDFDFAVAKRFSSAFAGEPTVCAATPRELVDFLAAKASRPHAEVLLTARAFYRIRRVIVSTLGVEARGVVPRTRLADLMPDPYIRRSQWSAIKIGISGTRAPSLVRPGGLASTIAVAVTAVFLVAVFSAAHFFSATWQILLFSAGGSSLLLWALLRATARWAVHFQSDDLTVGDLAYYAVAYDAPFIEVQYPGMTRSQVIEVVRALVRLEIGEAPFRLDSTWNEFASQASSS